MSRAMQLQRRRRFDGGGGEEEEESTTAAARCRCRSCAAVMVADCIAVGCCPCAVVSVLGLALVKAPLVVGRRCVGRLRTRGRALLHNKRVRDVAANANAVETKAAIAKAEADDVAVVVDDDGEAMGGGGGGEVDDDMAWLEEMYRMGHWGFGRVSVSGKTP
uniref:Uncharacterized protein n=1 Tax=Leersia perrieri TaxID=77586 RepID=A0A0D9WJW3_9ORYZ